MATGGTSSLNLIAQLYLLNKENFAKISGLQTNSKESYQTCQQTNFDPAQDLMLFAYCQLERKMTVIFRDHQRPSKRHTGCTPFALGCTPH